MVRHTTPKVQTNHDTLTSQRTNPSTESNRRKLTHVRLGASLGEGGACDGWHHLGCHMPAMKAPIHMGAVQSGHPIHGVGCHWLSPVV